MEQAGREAGGAGMKGLPWVPGQGFPVLLLLGSS